jgi:ketosteroid isomerase-like protein
MERDIQIIKELYAAFEKRDEKRIVLLFSPEVEIIQSAELPWGGHYRGVSGLSAFLNKLLAHVDSRVVIEKFIDAGEHVVAVGQTIGRACATKMEFDVPVVHVWTVREGQIVRFEPFIDNATMLAALVTTRL